MKTISGPQLVLWFLIEIYGPWSFHLGQTARSAMSSFFLGLVFGIPKNPEGFDIS